MSRTINRRTFLKVTAAALGAGVLSSCTPKATPTPVIVKETVVKEATKVVEKVVTTTPVPAAKPAMEGKKGILWGLEYDPHVAAYQRLAALFKKTTGGTMEVQPQGWPLEEKTLAAIAAKTAPDIVCVPGVWANGLMMQKALMPVDDLVFNPLGIKAKDLWVEAALQGWSWNGKATGIPCELSGCGWMVNVDVQQLKEAGIDTKYPPTNGKPKQFESYEQMWDCAKALQKKEGAKVTRWGISSQGWEANSYLGIVDSLLAPRKLRHWMEGERKFYIDTEEGIKAMQLLVENPVKMGIETQLDKNGIEVALEGRVALVRGNGTPATADGYKAGYHYELAAGPNSIPGQPELFVDMASWGFCAPAAAKNPDVAVAFLKMMTTLDGQREYARIYGGMSQVSYFPLLKAADHFENPDPNFYAVKSFKVFADIVAPKCGPVHNNWGGIEESINAVFADVRTGKITSQDAVKTMQKNLEAMDKEWVERIKKFS